MLHIQMKEKVDQYYQYMKNNNSMFLKAESGELQPEQINLYLESIYHIVNYTPHFLRKSMEIADQLDLRELKEFFITKIAEETGHDEWAKEDISQLRTKFANLQQTAPLPSIVAITDDLTNSIEQDPYLYLPYIFLTEYFTTLMGPHWVHNLQTKCNISSDMMTVIGKHAELDKNHVAFALDEFRTILKDYPHKQLLLSKLDKYLALFEIFCNEVAANGKS